MIPPNIQVGFRDPRFRAEMEISIPGNPIIRYSSEEIPRHLMDDFQAIVGDGKARIAVTTDTSIKDFGTGVSSSVMIVLSCNQDMKTIERAVDLAGQASRFYAQRNRQQAEMEMNQILAARQGVPR